MKLNRTRNTGTVNADRKSSAHWISECYNNFKAAGSIFDQSPNVITIDKDDIILFRIHYPRVFSSQYFQSSMPSLILFLRASINRKQSNHTYIVSVN